MFKAIVGGILLGTVVAGIGHHKQQLVILERLAFQVSSDASEMGVPVVDAEHYGYRWMPLADGTQTDRPTIIKVI
jgi:hypothetical protein